MELTFIDTMTNPIPHPITDGPFDAPEKLRVFHFADIPESFHRRAKLFALLEGIPLRELVFRSVDRELRRLAAIHGTDWE